MLDVSVWQEKIFLYKRYNNIKDCKFAILMTFCVASKIVFTPKIITITNMNESIY